MKGGRPTLPNGSLRLPCGEDGLYQFDPPRTFSACKAGTWEAALHGRLSDSRTIITKLRVNWGHASAHQLERVSVDQLERVSVDHAREFGALHG